MLDGGLCKPLGKHQQLTRARRQPRRYAKQPMASYPTTGRVSGAAWQPWRSRAQATRDSRQPCQSDAEAVWSKAVQRRGLGHKKAQINAGVARPRCA